MDSQLPLFKINIEDRQSSEAHSFVGGDDFHAANESISSALKLGLSPRTLDLLRIASSVYFADRISRRNRVGGSNRWARHLSLTVDLYDAEFWNDAQIKSLLTETLEFVSGDTWDLTFSQDRVPPPRPVRQLFLPEHYFDDPPNICLYSGGLDSAAGLARRCSEVGPSSFLPVTVCHRTELQTRVEEQLRLLSQVSQADLTPLCVGMTMQAPESLGLEEEPSQRTRSFLFVAVGGVVAAAVKSQAVELYEAGVGAINAPLLAGMEGSQATRSAHPTFLRNMAQLLSLVADYSINVNLPFIEMTKGEVLSVLKSTQLEELADMTFSCVSYPLRHPTKKFCGYCPACLFRRVALHAGGIAESDSVYSVDILKQQPIPAKKLKYLIAFLNQIDGLAEVDQGKLPRSILHHLLATELLGYNESAQKYVDLYHRYRREWLAFIEHARRNGCQWVNMITVAHEAA